MKLSKIIKDDTKTNIKYIQQANYNLFVFIFKFVSEMYIKYNKILLAEDLRNKNSKVRNYNKICVICK